MAGLVPVKSVIHYEVSSSVQGHPKYIAVSIALQSQVLMLDEVSHRNMYVHDMSCDQCNLS